MFARMVVTTAAVSGLLAAVSYLPAQSNEPAKPTLSGQVVGDDDQPVAGASVTQIGWKQAGPAVKADAEGRFSVSVEAAANGYIYAALYAQSDDGRLGFVTVEQTKPEPLRVVLKPARELDVVVQDRDGKAVAGAEVQFLANMRLLEVGTTDAEGRLKRRVPAEVRGWAVLARKSHLGFDYRTAERGRGATDTNPLPNEVTLKLDGARSVRVRAVDHRGQAVAGVKIGPWYIRKPGHEADINLSGATSLWPTTDAAGEVVLDWLPEKFEQALPLISRAGDYYAREHSVAIQAENPVSELTIELLPLERLSGRVTHADGRPAGGMNVMVRGQGTSHNGFQGATTTDGEGRYELKVYSEQAYLVRAGDEKLASPVHSDIVVRAGKPVAGIDLVVGPATRVRGRVTVGQDRRPVAKLYLSAVIDKGAITKELSRKGDDRYYYGLRMNFNAQTDAEGNYSFLLGPGEYQLSGPARTEPFKFTIPQSDAPAEIVHDFHMPRAETGPLALRVVDREGRAAPGAVVEGRYASQSARRWFGATKADDKGALQVERSLDPLVIFARSADKQLAGIARSEAEEPDAKVVIGPVATATGTLKDLEGKPVADRELTYGIRIFQGEPLRSPFSDSFGGATKTDAQGRFSLAGLVPGETYQLNVKLDEHSSRTITEVIAKDAAPLDLGELSADPNPTRPYVPPTPAERAAQGFAAKGDLPLAERLENLLAEARREYTQPLLLFGKADDPACIELYRLFEQREALSDEEKAKGDYLSPDELRWEFELAALDVDRPEVREQAAKLKVELAAGVPALAVLDQSGALLETLPLTMKDKKLDRRQIGGWLAQHKLPTRDAQQMLDEALAKAQKEDKRVFFILSASWCGPCRMLARFLAPHKSELEKHFVFVKLDVSRDEHADELKERFKESASGGVPWYCIVNPADGKVLGTSNLPEVNPQYGTSNMGFPTLPNEVEHFIGMLKSTAPRLKEERLAEYKAELLKKK